MMELVGALGTVAAAFVGGVFVVLAAALRRENTAQHAANQAKLEAIGIDVCEVKEDVREVRGAQQDHLQWHADRSTR